MIKIEDLKPKDYSYYGKGGINKNGKQVYVVTKNSKHVCSCRTYEQAYYVREEMNKCDWDKEELPRILEEYPVYYTDLLEFYRYVTIHKKSPYKWGVSIPAKKSDTGTTQQIRCTHIEDALYERDFLVENDWDYELLVYTIDDRENPYYNVELPPYPERKIKNVSVQKTHKKELELINQLLLDEPSISQSEVCKVIGVADMTLRNWLKSYGTDWVKYKKMVLEDGINPLTVLTLKRRIYKPDLSLKPSNFKNYISYEKKRSKKNPYCIYHNNSRYGQYSSRKLAEKIVKDLIKCDWDKKQLPNIQRKHGHIPQPSRNYVYHNPNDTYTVRKKVGSKIITFGTYSDYDLACMIRDKLKVTGWDINQLDSIRNNVEKEYYETT